MSIYLEDHLPVVKYQGLNTQKAVVLESTLAVTGISTFTAAPVFTAGIPSGSFLRTITDSA
jgi:hypothetical protein